MGQRARRDHLFVETDGQVYLVHDQGKLRFPQVGEKLPFPTEPNGVMDFVADRVLRQKPRLDYHPEEWLGRYPIFKRTDVDPLLNLALSTTMDCCLYQGFLSHS